MRKYEKEKGWIYGENEQELSSLIKNKTYEKLIEDNVDLAAQITTNFLGDIEKYRALYLMPAKELLTAYNDAQKDSTPAKRVVVKKDEFSRIWESTKAIKTAIEGLNALYASQRKALGMDREDDIEKARKIKHADKLTPPDPTENLTEEEIDKQIAEYDK